MKSLTQTALVLVLGIFGSYQATAMAPTPESIKAAQENLLRFCPLFSYNRSIPYHVRIKGTGPCVEILRAVLRNQAALGVEKCTSHSIKWLEEESKFALDIEGSVKGPDTECQDQLIALAETYGRLNKPIKCQCEHDHVHDLFKN